MVAPTRYTVPPGAGGPLLAWLLGALRPMSRTRVKQLLASGRVQVNGEATTRFDAPLVPGDRVEIARAAPIANRILNRVGLVVNYQDDAVIAVDKPPGLLTVATAAEKTDTAFVRLDAHLAAQGAGRAFVVHRLDRDTSGLLLFGRSAAARDALQAGWSTVMKTYLAVVHGVPRSATGVVEDYLTETKSLRVRACRMDEDGAKRAVTHYRVVRVAGRYSLLEVGLKTGRKHQIRVHLAGIGCPVVGDSTYGTVACSTVRLGLHAWRLAFNHPVTGACVQLESPLPAALRRVLD